MRLGCNIAQESCLCLLPGNQGCWGAGLLWEALWEMPPCQPKVLELHSNNVAVLCVVLSQVLTHLKYSLILPPIPLAHVTLGEVAQVRRPQS